jgi:hypothetical protein
MMDIDRLKSNVFPGESGGDYNALFGYSNRPGGLFEGINLTDMTVDEALQFANPSGPYGQWVKGQVGRVATPMGAFQVVGSTLRAAKEGLGLTGKERMDQATQDRIGQWIYQTQGPGAWEAWGKGGGAPEPRASTQGGQQMAIMEQQPQGLLGALGIQRRDPTAQGETALPFYQRETFGNTLDNVMLALNSMTLRPDPNLAQQIGQRRQERTTAKQRNRTLEYLRTLGTPQAVEAIRYAEATGDVAGALKMAQAQPDRTALMQNYEYALSQNMTPEQARAWVSSSPIINMPGAPTIGTIPPGYQAVKDPQTGRFTFEPIEGGPAAIEAETRAGQKSALASTAQDSIRLIDSVINDPSLGAVTGMFQGRLPAVTQSGTDLVTKIDQIKGQAFLQAFESLKGGGAITEREGIAAQNAIANLNRAQSEKAFKESLKALRDIVDRGRRRAAGENIPDGGGNDGIVVGDPY